MSFDSSSQSSDSSADDSSLNNQCSFGDSELLEDSSVLSELVLDWFWSQTVLGWGLKFLTVVGDRSASSSALAVLSVNQINLSLDGSQFFLGNGVVWVRLADGFKMMSLSLESRKSCLDLSALGFA